MVPIRALLRDGKLGSYPKRMARGRTRTTQERGFTRREVEMLQYLSIPDLKKDPEMVKLIVDESDAKGAEACSKDLSVSMYTVYGARYIGGKAIPLSVKKQFDKKSGVAPASLSELKNRSGKACLVCNKIRFKTMAEHFKKCHPQYSFTIKRATSSGRGSTRYMCDCGRVLNDFASIIKHYNARHSEKLKGIPTPQADQPGMMLRPASQPKVVTSNLSYGIRQFAEDLQWLLKETDSLREGKEKLETEYANLRRVISEQQVAMAEQLARLK